MDTVFKIGIAAFVALFIIVTFALVKAASDDDDLNGRDEKP